MTLYIVFVILAKSFKWDITRVCSRKLILNILVLVNSAFVVRKHQSVTPVVLHFFKYEKKNKKSAQRPRGSSQIQTHIDCLPVITIWISWPWDKGQVYHESQGHQNKYINNQMRTAPSFFSSFWSSFHAEQTLCIQNENLPINEVFRNLLEGISELPIIVNSHFNPHKTYRAFECLGI